ncbi:PadR family transcriptional regulator [Frondihabitans sp. PhB188]|uniref:PadR family transcriptional regulator n=1 Tax=Frondihabitans sp. PhB188 TaxID=2485200 RepID=UPI000F481CFE|nr:helix-turn-helix transcriptional regulator [Frondihabitans sp. PhB188]ROQ40739.1 PadR family transcriptional regulator [Frondihabitans sp. PhB188]
MEPLQRITQPTRDVLAALLQGGDEPVWGLLIMKSTGRPSGTIYPILERLERHGWVLASWEADTDRLGPRRRFYEFTADGRVAAAEVLAAQAPAPRPSRAAGAAGSTASGTAATA